MNVFIYAAQLNQGILFILGIVVLVILVFLRFYRVAATYMKETKNKKPDPEVRDT